MHIRSFSNTASYLKKPSPLTLNTDGSRTDQQPSEGFSSVEYGSLRPALGGYRYFAEPAEFIVSFVSKA